MNAAYNPYVFILILGLAALAFALTPLALAWLWARIYSPNKPSHEKERHLRVRSGIQRRRVDSFQVGVLPLRHDLPDLRRGNDFPAALRGFFTGLGVGAFLSLVVFLFLLVSGLVWAWMKGLLTWK